MHLLDGVWLAATQYTQSPWPTSPSMCTCNTKVHETLDLLYADVKKVYSTTTIPLGKSDHCLNVACSWEKTGSGCHALVLWCGFVTNCIACDKPENITVDKHQSTVLLYAIYGKQAGYILYKIVVNCRCGDQVSFELLPISLQGWNLTHEAYIGPYMGTGRNFTTDVPHPHQESIEEEHQPAWHCKQGQIGASAFTPAAERTAPPRSWEHEPLLLCVSGRTKKECHTPQYQTVSIRNNQNRKQPETVPFYNITKVHYMMVLRYIRNVFTRERIIDSTL